MGRLLWCSLLLTLSLSCAAPVPESQPVSITLDPPFVRAVLDPASPSAGDIVTLHIAMDVPQDQFTILPLSVDYPGEETLEVVKNVLGGETSMSWTSPDDASPGLASFSVTMLDCGCSPYLSGTSSARDYSGVLTGEFIVE